MATKVYLNTPKHAAPGAIVTMGAYMTTIAGVTGATGFKQYKSVDKESVVPILRSYTSIINGRGVSGASVPVLKNIDDQRVPVILKSMSTALNVLKP